MEGLEIERVSHADRRAMITVTPSHVVTILDKTYTGVVGINKLADLLVVALKLEFCLGDTPMNGICTNLRANGSGDSYRRNGTHRHNHL